MWIHQVDVELSKLFLRVKISSVSATYLRLFNAYLFSFKVSLTIFAIRQRINYVCKFYWSFFLFIWTLFERHYPKKDTSGFRWSRVCFLNIFVVFFRLHFVKIISNLQGKMTFVFHHFSNHLVQMITNFFWCSLNLSFGKCNAIH